MGRTPRGAEDGTTSVWDVATRRWLATLTLHAGPVWAVAFSPDGSLLATGSLDFTVRLWNPSPGIAGLVLREQTDAIRNLSIAPCRHQS